MAKVNLDHESSDVLLDRMVGKYVFEIFGKTSPHYKFVSAAGAKIIGIKRADDDPKLIAILFKGDIGFVFEEGFITYREELPDGV